MKIGYLLLSGMTLSLCLRAQLPVTLGSDVNFAVLANSTVTNTGATVVTSNLGVSPGSAVTGFPPGTVTGGIIHAADGVAATAHADLVAAYTDALGRTCTHPVLAELGGTTVVPGISCFTSAIAITGTVTLDGGGNSGSVFIIQTPSTLTTAAGNSLVRLINGAVASNVFWQVGSSATLGTNTFFSGTILAAASVTVNTGAQLNGRALARDGAVTLAGNAVTNPGVPGTTGAGLTLSCAFPSGFVGQPYVSALVASGGLSPYTFSISAGSLPPILTLNASTGAITGTPTTVGTFNYSATVVDTASSPSTVTTACTGIVIGATPPVTPAPPTLILLSIALACLAAYQGRERLRGLLKWN